MTDNKTLKLNEEDRDRLMKYRDMVDYGSTLLADTTMLKNRLSPKQRYLMLVFTAANNYAEGIFTLCNAFRPESAVVLLRSLVEAYINTAYLLSHNSNNRLMLIYTEDCFYSKGLIEEVIRFYNKYPKLRPQGDGYKQDNLERLKGEYDNLIKDYAKKLKEELSSHKKFKQKHAEVIDLLERAKIADKRFKKGSFEYNYLMVYRYFSEYAHLSLKGMSHFFKQTNSGFVGTSSQSPEINHIVVTAYFMYLYFLEKLKFYKLLPNLKISIFQKQLGEIFRNFKVV